LLRVFYTSGSSLVEEETEMLKAAKYASCIVCGFRNRHKNVKGERSRYPRKERKEMESGPSQSEEVDKSGKGTNLVRSTLFWLQGESGVVRGQAFRGIQCCFQEESRFMKEKGITARF
jgi:hypothetical protein